MDPAVVPPPAPQQDPAALLQQMQQMQGLMAQQSQQIHALTQQVQQFQLQVPAPQQQQQQASSSFKCPKPDMYSGKPASQITSWLIQMEAYLAESNVNLLQDVAVAKAAMYLKGPLLEWYQVQKSNQQGNIPFPDWAAFKATLTTYLLPVDPSITARDRLDNLRQLSSVAQYASEFNSTLVHIVDMSMADRVHKFIKGLKREVKMQVRLHNPRDLQQAQQLASQADTAIYTSNRTQYTGSRGSQPSNSSSGPAPMELGTHDSEVSVITCYKCRQPGHIARNCPQQQHDQGSNNHNSGRGRGRGRGRRPASNTPRHGAPN